VGSESVRRCCGCGNQLASDNHTRLCSPCFLARRDYDPRADPHFLYRLCDLFVDHEGERLDPVMALGLPADCRRWVRDRVRVLRQQGMDIRGTPRVVGYRFVGWVEVSRASGGSVTN